jgi:hypothetical protein
MVYDHPPYYIYVFYNNLMFYEHLISTLFSSPPHFPISRQLFPPHWVSPGVIQIKPLSGFFAPEPSKIFCEVGLCALCVDLPTVA